MLRRPALISGDPAAPEGSRRPGTRPGTCARSQFPLGQPRSGKVRCRVCLFMFFKGDKYVRISRLRPALRRLPALRNPSCPSPAAAPFLRPEGQGHTINEFPLSPKGSSTTPRQASIHRKENRPTKQSRPALATDDAFQVQLRCSEGPSAWESSAQAGPSASASGPPSTRSTRLRKPHGPPDSHRSCFAKHLASQVKMCLL